MDSYTTQTKECFFAWKLFFIPLLFLITLKTHRTYAGGGDQSHYLLIAESLLSDGYLRMENQYPASKIFLPHLVESPGHSVRTPLKSIFPMHDIGLPILMLPFLEVVNIVVPRIPVTLLDKLHMDPLNFCVAL